MRTLMDFAEAKRRTLQAPAQVTTKGTELTVSNALTTADIPQDQADRFAKDVLVLMASDEFLKELSAQIREPGITETRDEFVARCMATATVLLENKLG